MRVSGRRDATNRDEHDVGRLVDSVDGGGRLERSRRQGAAAPVPCRVPFTPAGGAVLLFGGIRSRSGETTLWRASSAIAWAMIAVAILGFMFTWWARFTLGRL